MPRYKHTPDKLRRLEKEKSLLSKEKVVNVNTVAKKLKISWNTAKKDLEELRELNPRAIKKKRLNKVNLYIMLR